MEAAYAEADAALRASAAAAATADLAVMPTSVRLITSGRSSPQKPAAVGRRTVSSDDDCFSAGSSDPGAAPGGLPEHARGKGQSKGSGSQATAPLTPHSIREPALTARGRLSE